MADHDSNAINALGSPWERENDEKGTCKRCQSKERSECICADELRDRQRDDDLSSGDSGQ